MKVIQTPQGRVAVDENTEIIEGERFYHPLSKTFDIAIHCQGKITHPYPKLIATCGFSIDKDVPMYLEKDEVEVEKLFKEYLKRRCSNMGHFQCFDEMECRGTFFDSFKIAQEKGTFTEEQMGIALDTALSLWINREQGAKFEDIKIKTIQSLKEETIEFEMEDFVEEETGHEYKWINKKIKTERNLKGQLICFKKQ